MKTLPLLDLPDSTLRATLRRLEPKKLITMVQKSSELREVASHWKIPVKTLKWSWNSVTSSNKIEINYGTGSHRLTINMPDIRKQETAKNAPPLQMEDVTLCDSEEHADTVILKLTPRNRYTSQDLLKMFTDFLLDLFRVESFELDASFRAAVKFRNFYIWTVTRKFSKLRVFLFFEENLSDALKFFNEDLESENWSLVFSHGMKYTSDVLYSVPLRGKSVEVYFAQFLHPDVVTKSACKDICLAACNINVCHRGTTCPNRRQGFHWH